MKRTIALLAGMLLAGAAGYGAVLVSGPGGEKQPAATEKTETREGCPTCAGCSGAAGPETENQAGRPSASVITLDEEGRPTAPTPGQMRGLSVERARTVRPVEVPTKAVGVVASIVEVDSIETRSVAVVGEDGTLTVHCETVKGVEE